MTRITVPELCLVVLAGVSGAGKSTFAARHFRPTEVLSSDAFRAMVADDPDDQEATAAAFDALEYVAGKRLAAGRLTVVDATSVQPEARRSLIALARRHHVLAVAIVLDVPETVCAARNAARADRHLPAHALARQHAQLRRGLRGLRKEGFHRVFVLDGPDAVEAAEVGRERLWNDRRDQHGPFDVIGDVHGCFAELADLLGRLGYQVAPDGSAARHPGGRTAVFVGDLVDRGPATPAVLRLVMGMTAAGTALAVAGNHEAKLLRALRGRNVTTGHGLAQTLAQLAAEPEGFRREVPAFLDGLLGHLVLDDGKLVVAHAGLPEAMHGRASAAVRSFALYGDTTGETDEFGLPVRYPWADDYRGRALVAYGHTPVPEAAWVNGTICLDTGCVFGGALTALRYPERELVAVPARGGALPAGPAAGGGPRRPGPRGGRAGHRRRARKADHPHRRRPQHHDQRAERAGRPGGHVQVRPGPALAALPAADDDPGGRQRAARPARAPAGGLPQLRRRRRDQPVVRGEAHGLAGRGDHRPGPRQRGRRFGVPGAGRGVIYTRTGRAFFADPELAAAVLDRLAAAIAAAGLWDELDTGWLALDCELLPWSAKAAELLRGQYAPAAAAAQATLRAECEVLEAAAARGAGTGPQLALARERLALAGQFAAAYRRYCWPVSSADDLRLAPFQVLAGEAAVHARRPRGWHLEMLGRLAAQDPGLLRATRAVPATVGDEASEQAAARWWQELTEGGGEGMVAKPADPARRRPGHSQPGIKCRGREYLRLIYGPEYTRPENLERLRARNLGRKRALAVREHALGLEALDRFTAGEPLYRVHECVFGVLALESEPVDPRL